MTPRQVLLLTVSVLLTLVLMFSAGSIFESLDADEVMVIQSPVSGELVWYTTPGMKLQMFGKVTKYQKRSQLWFSNKADQGSKIDQSLKISFNDGGHARLSGGISWEIPLNEKQLTMLHTRFGSQEAIEAQLIDTVVQKAVYMTGPLMSSTESYASRRNDLLHLIEDQIDNGICLTKSTQQLQPDPITGEKKTVTIVELVLDTAGAPCRAEGSPLKEFGVKTFNLAINDINYDGRVEEQIQQQQQATMQVQIAIAKAKEAEQAVLTTKKQGEASAATAEWEQKAISAKETQKALMDKTVAETKAAQLLAVAKLDRESAEQFKQAETLRGEGEAARRKAILAADGALQIKLDTWLKAQQAFAAERFGQHQGAWVPTVQMGNSGGSGFQLIDLLTAKTAMDLGLNLKADVK